MMGILSDVLLCVAKAVQSKEITPAQATQVVEDLYKAQHKAGLLQQSKAMQAQQAAAKANPIMSGIASIGVASSNHRWWVSAGGGGGGGTSTIVEVGVAKPKEWWEGRDGIRSQRLFLMQLEPTAEFIETVLNPDIIDETVAWLNDKGLMKYSRQAWVRHTCLSQRDYLLTTFGGKNLKLRLPSRYWFIYAIDPDRSKNDIFIGTITGFITDADKSVDIGILLGTMHGNGYAAEAMSAVINYYNARGVTTFTCGCHPDNAAMIKLAKTCGMNPIFHGVHQTGFMMMIPSSKPKAEAQARVMEEGGSWTWDKERNGWWVTKDRKT